MLRAGRSKSTEGREDGGEGGRMVGEGDGGCVEADAWREFGLRWGREGGVR